MTPTVEGATRQAGEKRRGRRGSQVTPTAEGVTRQAGDTGSGVSKTQAGEQKEGATRQAGDQKEWARRLKGRGDEAGRQLTKT